MMKIIMNSLKDWKKLRKTDSSLVVAYDTAGGGVGVSIISGGGGWSLGFAGGTDFGGAGSFGNDFGNAMSTGMWTVNTGVGFASLGVAYKGKYHTMNEIYHMFKNSETAYFWQKRFKKLKGVRTIQTNKVSSIRKFSTKLTKVGGALVVADIALSGEIKPSHVINSIMLGASMTGFGTVIASAWFIADFGTMGINYLMGNGAVGLGDMLDQKIGTFEMYEGLY